MRIEELSLRPADIAIHDSLAQWITDPVSALWWGGPEAEYPVSPSLIEKFLNEEGTLSFTAVGRDNPAGFCQLRGWDPERSAVRAARIIVSPAERGRGVGVRMMELLCREARESLGADEIELYVFGENSAAQRCYLKAGFEHRGPAERGLPGPGGDYDLLRMSRLLGPSR